MSNIVYLLWDPRNGDVRYVGKTMNPEVRLRYHRTGNGTRGYCHNWEHELIREGFCCETAVVEKGLTDTEAITKECWWIAYGRQWGWPLTNITEGGEGAPGHEVSPQTREKLRRASLGHRHSPEAKEKIRLAGLRCNRSPETLEKMSQPRLWKRPAESRERIAKALLGRKHSAEARAKMSATQKGKKQSPETVEARRKANTGRKRTPETKEKIRQAALRRYREARE